jgi:predicted nuclease with TOPRIM domain
MFSRKDVAAAAKDLAAHLALVDDVAALQKMQKEMADAIAKLNERLKDTEAEMRVLRAEAKLDAVREAQQMINAVQGALYQKLTDLTVRVSALEGRHDSKAPLLRLHSAELQDEERSPP